MSAENTVFANLQISNDPFEDFGRFERELARAADLTRYSAIELGSVEKWMVIRPEYFAWRDSGFGSLRAADPMAATVATVVPPASFHETTNADSNWTNTTNESQATPLTTSESSHLPSATISPMSRFPGAEVWRFPTETTWQDAAAEMAAQVGQGNFYPLVRKRIEPKFVPNDPLFSEQWHLRNVGQTGGTPGQDANVVPAWDLARGTNVVIGIVDDGVDYLHPDIAPAYRADLDYDYFEDDSDAFPSAALDDVHGTAVAGVAAARGNNAIGVTGSAPNAQIAGIRFDAGLDDEEANALSHEIDQISIFNNSWGAPDGSDYLLGPGPLTRDAILIGTATGRGGRGSIYTWAGGNGREYEDDTNYDGYTNSVYVMAVGAINDLGRQTAYSEPGASLLISAPSAQNGSGTVDGIWSTDLRGNEGYNYMLGSDDGDPAGDLDYTATFSGTSSATPLVSGVIALMLEENPNLSWRDVRAILIETARKNDPTDQGWTDNGAGYPVNHKYGFGAIDAAAAVELAASWTTIGQGTLSTTGTIASRVTIPDNSNTGLTTTTVVTADLPNIEYVEVTVDTTHPYAGDLEFVLTSPSGTRSVLSSEHSDDTDYDNWTFGTVRHWGESTAGNWLLTVYDRAANDVGSLQSYELTFYTGPPRPPVAVTDSRQTRPGVPIDIDVLTNDIGRTDITSVRVVSGPTPNVGTAVVLPSGLIRFTPQVGFNGTVTFQYTVEGPTDLVSNPATVSVAVNEPPRAVADLVSTDEDVVGNFNVAANDNDIDGTIVATTVEITGQPQHGTAAVDAAGRIVYTPAANYNGSDMLAYRVKDDDGGVSLPELVTITVRPVNDAPTTSDDAARGLGGVAAQVDVLSNDTDIDSTINPASVQIVTQPSGGSAVALADGRIEVTPPLGFVGLLTFTYAVRDQQGALSAPATVRITTAAPPITATDTANIDEDQTIVIDVLANDVDLDGVIVRSTLAVAQAPAHGTATVDAATQRIRYVPEANYFGTDTFRYTVRDNEGNTSAPGLVTINLREINDAPVGTRDALGLDPGATFVIDVVANDIDVDGTVVRTSVNIPAGGRPAHGQATVNAVTGQITYVAPANYIGPDAFTYFMRDDDGVLSGETTVLVRVGRPVSFSGIVFADTNGNGAFDASEIGVPNAEVAAVMTDGLFDLRATVRTQDDGSFSILDRPTEGVVLPRGVYSLVQVHPAAFVDGVDLEGTPPPVAMANDRFFGIALDEGDTAADFQFAERGLLAPFISAYLNRRLYFASAAPGGRLFGARRGRAFDLAEGEAMFSFDSGAPGRVTLSAAFDAGSGDVRLEVLDQSLNVVKSAISTTGSVAVEFGPVSGPFFLRLTGSGSNVLVSSTTLDVTPRVGASVEVSGSEWSPATFSRLAGVGLGSAGFALAATEGANTATVSWTNVDTISVQFDAPVSVAANSLHIAAASGASYAFTDYFYDAPTRTGHWILDRPLARDNYLIEVLPLTGLVDFGMSSAEPAQLRFSVVPGDVDGDGAAGYLDAIAVRNAATSFGSMTPYASVSPRLDLNADGAINQLDFLGVMASAFRGRVADEVSQQMLGGLSVGSPSALVRRAPGRAAARPVLAAEPSSRHSLSAAAVDSAVASTADRNGTMSLRARRRAAPH